MSATRTHDRDCALTRPPPDWWQQNHFCPSCRELGIDIPAERVRGLRRELRHELENSNAFGMWSKHGTRLVNQTSGCTGVLLVIFKEPPSAWGPSLPAVLARESAWEPVPPDWSGPTTVHFAVAKGTLVPKGALSYRSTKTYATGPGGTVVGTYASNGPVPDRQHDPKEGGPAPTPKPTPALAPPPPGRPSEEVVASEAAVAPEAVFKEMVKREAAVAGAVAWDGWAGCRAGCMGGCMGSCRASCSEGEVAGKVAPRPSCASCGSTAAPHATLGCVACARTRTIVPPTSHHRAREQSDEAVGLAPKRARLATGSGDLESLPACMPNTWTAAAAAAAAAAAVAAAVGAAAAVVEGAEEKRAAAERAAEERAAAEPDLPHPHAPYALVLSPAPPASPSASSPTVGVAPADAPSTDCPIALLLAAPYYANGNGNSNGNSSALPMDLRFQCLSATATSNCHTPGPSHATDRPLRLGAAQVPWLPPSVRLFGRGAQARDQGAPRVGSLAPRAGPRALLPRGPRRRVSSRLRRAQVLPPRHAAVGVAARGRVAARAAAPQR